MANSTLLDRAWADRPSIRKRVYEAIKESPHYSTLFETIASHTCDLRALVSASAPDEGVPASKRRRLVDSSASATLTLHNPAAEDNTDASSWNVHATFNGVSFSVPARKKLTLDVCLEGVRAQNPNGNTAEFWIRWRDVEHAFCLPVPEKAARLNNIVLLPYGSSLPPPSTTPSAHAHVEPILFSVAADPSQSESPSPDQPTKPAPTTALLAALQSAAALGSRPLKIQTPRAETFKSLQLQPHRRDETAYHVKAFLSHRGSKEGYLFFLDAGIFWGYKKPLLFFPVERVREVSFTSVLARTFNLVVGYVPEDADVQIETKTEIEFQMLDQADYASICTYVNAHDFSNASLAAARRAKVYNVNSAQRGKAEKENTPHEDIEEHTMEESELQKAERLAEQKLQDEEDALEEDYEPGESDDGSGESESDEDEDDDRSQWS